jgi:hypothetical protein
MIPRQYSARRHSAKPLPLFEADRDSVRAARHLARRYNQPISTARAVAEAAGFAMREARR